MHAHVLQTATDLDGPFVRREAARELVRQVHRDLRSLAHVLPRRLELAAPVCVLPLLEVVRPHGRAYPVADGEEEADDRDALEKGGGEPKGAVLDETLDNEHLLLVGSKALDGKVWLVQYAGKRAGSKGCQCAEESYSGGDEAHTLANEAETIRPRKGMKFKGWRKTVR